MKAENLQRTGSFKIRGSYNRISALGAEERARGVVAASAGNHAQGVALAARTLGVASTIFMPVDASMAKVQATVGYGARRSSCSGATFDDAQAAARERRGQHGRDLHLGVRRRARHRGPGHRRPRARRAGAGRRRRRRAVRRRRAAVGHRARADARCCPACASSASRRRAARPSCAPLQHGQIEAAARAQTIADGIAVKRPGELTFPLVQRHVDDMVAVTDEEIVEAIALLLERQKLVVEGAGAVGVAALLGGHVPRRRRPPRRRSSCPAATSTCRSCRPSSAAA